MVGEDLQEFLDGVYKVLSSMGVTSMEKAELPLYQLRDVAQVWYTKWKDNRTVELGPIQWEEFKEAFLGKYFPHERREVKEEEYINLKHARYAPTPVSNLRDELSYFVMGVTDLAREECRTTMLHDDMTLARHMKGSQTQEEPRNEKVKFEKEGGSQNGKPTSVTCGKRHYGECLKGTRSCFGCGKEGHKVRECPTISSRGREGKQVVPYVPTDDAPNKWLSYALRAKGSKSDEDEE
ncbi:uncharacterized protein [Solanum lycopersicum]|uniref:uncharacterized protein n=1 Tax=Solanum lycopersicum TaxID=4081 RepID=UPI0037484AD0